jgi:hypothetical protein
MKKEPSILGVESTLVLENQVLFAISLVIPCEHKRMPLQSGLGKAL